MKTIILSLFIILSINLYSQDWNLINKNYKYNYSLGSNSVNNYNTTVYVDSIFVNNEDTIFYLNRIVTKCDTCPNFGLSYLFYNQPTLLQRKVLKRNNVYTFYDTSSFTIDPNNNIGEIWIFDSLNNITAEIVSKNNEYTFGVLDSIKYVKLSTNDTIIISKNFGIIKFQTTDSLHAKYYLIGVENINGSFGFVIPRFFDFFNYNIGDIFQYYSSGCWWGNGGDCSNYVYKMTILTKTIIADTIKYMTNINGKHWETQGGMPGGDTTYFNYTDTILYIDSINNLANFYNHQLIRENFDSQLYYSKVDAYFDNDGLFTKKIGLEYGYMPFYEIDTNFVNVLQGAITAESYNRTLKIGLGQTIKSYSWFEASETIELIGYVKDNDTIGVVNPDYILKSESNNTNNNNIRIYPNPSSNLINIEFNNYNKKTNIQISIFDMFGRIINEIQTFDERVQISNLSKGIYSLRIKSNDYIVTRIIVIN